MDIRHFLERKKEEMNFDRNGPERQEGFESAV
jgi:hypothetical protein